MLTGSTPILLVDDSPDDVMLMERALAKANITGPVHVVRDGVEAMDYLTRRGQYADAVKWPFPVLILLDLKMPRMNGLELLAWIRQQPQLKRQWVVILSHSQEISDINMAYELGANSYLVKPNQLNALIEKMDLVRRYWLMLCERPEVHRKPEGAEAQIPEQHLNSA